MTFFSVCIKRLADPSSETKSVPKQREVPCPSSRERTGLLWPVNRLSLFLSRHHAHAAPGPGGARLPLRERRDHPIHAIESVPHSMSSNSSGLIGQNLNGRFIAGLRCAGGEGIGGMDSGWNLIHDGCGNARLERIENWIRLTLSW